MGGTGRSIALGLALAAALTAAPRDSRATDPDQPSYELGLYVWGNSLVSTIDTEEGSATSRIPFSDLLDNLNVAAMLRARANFDKLSIVFDGEYFDLESETHRQTIRLGPQGNLEVEASAKVKLVQYILELNAGYQIFDLDAPYSLVRGDELRTRGELYAGARYLSMKPEIEVQVGAQRTDIGNWESWVDGVVGARLAFDLSENVEQNQIVVAIRVEARFAARIREDSLARIRTRAADSRFRVDIEIPYRSTARATSLAEPTVQE